MSEGPRLPLTTASKVAQVLFERWELSGLLPDHSAANLVVGSVRRRRDEVGDIELAAPLPGGWETRKLSPSDDPLFRRINETMSNPWRDESTPLFGAQQTVPDQPLGYAVRGLKPGFLACSLVLRTRIGIELPCQIYRYTPKNRGWLLIERTGPRDFGKWFLWRWKLQHGIPVGNDRARPASTTTSSTRTGTS
ncbi:MAG: hypothetical protein ACKVW3_13095 [Phycisphaerales bacterium]